MALTSRRLTLEQFLALPEEKPALEYRDGVVTQKLSPKAHHGTIQFAFAEKVNVYGTPRRLALAFIEVRSAFGGAVYVPDVGVYRWENVPRGSDGKLLPDFQIPWDLVAEIVSPGQSRAELEEKCRWYVGNGVAIALMIDPAREDVVRFGADGSRAELRDDARIDLDAVVPGLDVTPGELFAALYPG